MADMDAPNSEPDLFAGELPLPISRRSEPPQNPKAAISRKRKDAFKTISETADMLDLPQHVLRFWESKFSIIKPLKLKGGRRYYRPQDVEALVTIKQLLYKEGYTIKGAKRAISQARRLKVPVLEHVAKDKRSPQAQREMDAQEDKKKQELKEIYSDLLELRGLIEKLPRLKTDA